MPTLPMEPEEAPDEPQPAFRPTAGFEFPPDEAGMGPPMQIPVPPEDPPDAADGGVAGPQA